MYGKKMHFCVQQFTTDLIFFFCVRMCFHQSVILVGETDSEQKIMLAGKNAG